MKKKYTSEELAEIFDSFIEQYRGVISEESISEIRENFLKGPGNKNPDSFTLELFEDLGMIPDKVSPHYTFLEELCKSHSLKKNIIEVGGGMIPTLGNLIAERQKKIGNGTITIYDPLLSNAEPKFSNMSLKRNYFTFEEDLSNYDLMIGLAPCEGLIQMLTAAGKYNLDFFIELCSCEHRVPSSKIKNYKMYVLEYAKYVCDKFGLGTLKVIPTTKKSLNIEPIIYNKRLIKH